MRKKLIAAAVATLMGMGVTTAIASPTPYAGLVDGAAYINSFTVDQLSGDTALAGYNPQARGTVLAGLVDARDRGVNGLTTTINGLADDIISSNGAGDYFGDEAYGVAKTDAGRAANVSTFYATNVTPDEAGFISFYFGTGSSVEILDLSYHVLASDLVGSASAGTLRTELQNQIANLDITVDYDQSVGEPSSIQALALGLWALAETGATGTTGINGGGDDLAGLSLADLRDRLITYLTGDQLYFEQKSNGGGQDPLAAGVQTDAAYGYAEDLAYGILALKATGANPALILQLEYSLAATISASQGVGYNIADPQNIAFSPQYTGAALQALPEPATLSLLGLGGMALLARRRRLA